MNQEQIEMAAKKLQELVLKHDVILNENEAIFNIQNMLLTYEADAIIYVLTKTDK